MSNSYALPDNFVYLDQVAPTILQEIRYAGNDNFIGKPIPGYQSPRCILSKQTAEQLQKIQADAQLLGFNLKVYDCYRPQSAVDSFYTWSQNPTEVRMKPWFYPNEPKDSLFDKRYIAIKSGHSRGSTVDITLVSLKKQNDSNHDSFERDNPSIDMGAPFDFFDPRAHVFAKGLNDQQRLNRLTLRTLMLQNGFVPYPEEWWHFTLKEEPYPETYFNFPVS